MAVKLRLKRMGSKQKPFYRIVAADSRSPRDGRFIEIVGTYNPIKKPAELSIDEEKALKWLNNGAIPTDTVKNLFTQKGINAKYAESKVKKSTKAPAKKAAVKEEKPAEKKTTAKKTTTKKAGK
jgi:small subunit ribosomal protein S16